jgi:hypothetical protein
MKKLGSNEILELLPVGRRIAFDPGKGRLWVVCRSCDKWNLVPFDTRLETIDACERIFSEARTRFSTDNIGIARPREGLELVRIGPALRPEFAAWRYGDRFASRRRRNVILAGTAGAAVIGAMIGVEVLAGSTIMINVGYRWLFRAHDRFRIATRFASVDGGEPLTLSRADVKEAQLHVVDGAPGSWGLRVPARFGVRGHWSRGSNTDRDVMLTGPDAVLALGHLLPVIAGTAGSKRQVRDAVAMLEEKPALDALIPRPRVFLDARGTRRPVSELGALGKLGAERRLAMEMLAHEESERRWLEGELKLLERQWRDADRLAAIADDLATPDEVVDPARGLPH